LTVIREELRHIVQQRQADDSHLRYLDGLDLYGQGDFADLPPPDQLHPEGLADRRVGGWFAKFAFGCSGLFCVECRAQ